MKQDPWSTLIEFQQTLLNGIFAWMCFLPIATAFLYIVMLPFLRVGINKYNQRVNSQEKAK